MFNSGRGKDPKREVMGTVEDERLSRLLWLNYLAGSKVASEPARESIIEGVMEFVERPVGTVATQVV
ncbi:chalcone isomerase like domain-containing protein [Trichoderma breve]|nr:chalcone isomerase like domain-containing protein [Trichoderma breve]KAJ4856645.1 chalcone isomerase like domain-containing protein [Trichoderma breve]